MKRLAQASSPFLLAHAAQPVAWRPWEEASLELARRQERPILLAIGYASCHWCHVMATESFSDPVCAEVMNRHFVCILLDKEEHPEVDEIYQKAHALLTHKAGGWPLISFLTPDGLPFYSGNYYPPSARYGLPAFITVLEKVARAWLHQRSAIAEQGPKLHEALQQALLAPHEVAGGHLDRSGVRACQRQLLEQFDARHGGFGSAPKFPSCSQLELLLHIGSLREEEDSRHAALHSLRKMAEGGLCDQLGGGFFRYCSDAAWQHPHFEKRLSDNAQLLWLYSEAFALSGEELFRRTAERCAQWMLSTLRNPAGSFCSALDADSAGGEGLSYLWQRTEINTHLDGERLALISAHFGLDAPPSHPGERWLLRVHRPLEEVAACLAIPPVTARQHLDAACERLLALRATRPQPARDEQILTSSNAFAIRALARGAQIFARSTWLDAAQRALASLLESNFKDDLLLTCSSAGQSGPPGVLDDYAALLSACLELLQAQFRPQELALARQLADTLLDQFEDPSQGGFYSTAHDAPQLIARTRPIHDGAHPAGNFLAARSLLRLGHLLAETRYIAAAERCLRAFHASLQEPADVASLALLLEEWLAPPAIVILRGEAEECARWHSSLRRQSHLDLLCLNIPEGLPGLPPSLDKPAGASSSAWICRGAHCLPPAGDLPSLLEAIRPAPDYLPESWLHSSLINGMHTT